MEKEREEENGKGGLKRRGVYQPKEERIEKEEEEEEEGIRIIRKRSQVPSYSVRSRNLSGQLDIVHSKPRNPRLIYYSRCQGNERGTPTETMAAELLQTARQQTRAGPGRVQHFRISPRLCEPPPPGPSHFAS